MKLTGISLFPIVFLLLFSKWAGAQHCGYCNASIQVYHIYAADNSKSISGLKIYLLDSLDQPIKTSRFDFKANDYVIDTFFIHQNPPERTSEEKKDKLNTEKSRPMGFWFAKDNYVFLPRSETNEGVKIVIEDIDGQQNEGKFKTRAYYIDDKPLFMLCTSLSKWTLSQGKNSFLPNYEALDIPLERE